jgi:hypothetical protein
MRSAVRGQARALNKNISKADQTQVQTHKDVMVQGDKQGTELDVQMLSSDAGLSHAMMGRKVRARTASRHQC